MTETGDAPEPTSEKNDDASTTTTPATKADDTPGISDDTDPSALSEEDLRRALQSATARFATHNERQKTLGARLQALQTETARRRTLLREAAVEEAHRIQRRSLAARGAAPPPPLRSASPPAPRAAASRLAGLSIATKAGGRPTGGMAERERTETTPAAGRDAATTVMVSDHAVVRYMERVLGIDVDSIRSRILTPGIERAVRSGVGRIRTAEGLVVAKGAIITSFLPHDAGPARRSNHGIRTGRPDVPVDLGDDDGD